MALCYNGAMNTNCEKCNLFMAAAIENGFNVGICEECFNKSFVHLNLIHDPHKSNSDDKGPKSIITTCGDWE